MSAFRSLYERYATEASQEKPWARPWPATYRDPLPYVKTEDFTLQIRIENQLAKTMNRRQLATLPHFTENRRITSKAGWTYYGQWKGITFQTFFSLFSTPNLYPWVRLELLDGQQVVIERTALLNYRALLECDGEDLSVLYGGPVWIHCFDYYVEYSIPHVKSIILMQGDHHYSHPHEKLGYTLDKARVEPGDYYAIHHEKIVHL